MEESKKEAVEKNLSIWKQVDKTDIDYTRSFSNGRFRGTTINQTYLVKMATAVFGPIGIGWGYDIIDERIVDGAIKDEKGNRDKVHVLRVKLWYNWEGKRGEVEHFGQTTFVRLDAKNTWQMDEEAPKKSLTDALSKCFSMLGFSADVYMGLYDDNKYIEGLRAEKEEVRRQAAPEPGKAPAAQPAPQAASPVQAASTQAASPAAAKKDAVVLSEQMMQNILKSISDCNTLAELENKRTLITQHNPVSHQLKALQDALANREKDIKNKAAAESALI